MSGGGCAYRLGELGGMSHGGELETSLMFHLRPELVEMDKMEFALREVRVTADFPLTVFDPRITYE